MLSEIIKLKGKNNQTSKITDQNEPNHSRNWVMWQKPPECQVEISPSNLWLLKP